MVWTPFRWGTGNDSAVSPVVGVVMLVAIVVLLAGTLSYVVLGVETGRPPTPQFSKVHDYNQQITDDGQRLTITHGSGEVAETADMRLVIDDAVVRDTSSDTRIDSAKLAPGSTLTDQLGSEWKVQEDLVVDGTTMVEESGDPIGPGEYLDLSEASIEIVWVPENEGTSDVLFEWTGPNA